MKRKEGRKINLHPKNDEKSTKLPTTHWIALDEVDARAYTYGEFCKKTVNYHPIPDIKKDEEGYVFNTSEGKIVWWKKKAFETKYRKAGKVTLGIVIEKLLNGFAARRFYWPNNKFIQLQSGYQVNEAVHRFSVSEDNNEDFYGEMSQHIITVELYADPIKKGKVHIHFSPWIPSQEDLLASDYVIVSNPNNKTTTNEKSK